MIKEDWPRCVRCKAALVDTKPDGALCVSCTLEPEKPDPRVPLGFERALRGRVWEDVWSLEDGSWHMVRIHPEQTSHSLNLYVRYVSGPYCDPNTAQAVADAVEKERARWVAFLEQRVVLFTEIDGPILDQYTREWLANYIKSGAPAPL